MGEMRLHRRKGFDCDRNQGMRRGKKEKLIGRGRGDVRNLKEEALAYNHLKLSDEKKTESRS